MVGIGIIGTGRQGADHARRVAALGDHVRLAAIHDIDRALAERVGAEVACRVADNDLAVINDPEVDAIIIASVTQTHVDLVLSCIAAGKPVLVEKPLGPTVPSCTRVLDAEIAAGRRLTQVGFMRRFDPEYRRIKETIEAGTIGDPLIIHCIQRSRAVPAAFRTRQTLTDLVIHEIDLARWLLGEEIVSVALERPRHGRRASDLLDDPLLVRLEAKGGARIDIEAFVNAGYGYDVRCEVVGTTGYVAMQPTARHLVTLESAPEQGFPADWLGRFSPAYDEEVASWVESLSEPDPDLSPGAWDGYAATVVAEALVRAMQTGHREAVSVGPRPHLYD